MCAGMGERGEKEEEAGGGRGRNWMEVTGKGRSVGRADAFPPSSVAVPIGSKSSRNYRNPFLGGRPALELPAKMKHLQDCPCMALLELTSVPQPSLSLCHTQGF